MSLVGARVAVYAVAAGADALDAQVERCRKFVLAIGGTVALVLADVAGTTVHDAVDAPGFVALVEAARAGAVNVVVVDAMARIADHLALAELVLVRLLRGTGALLVTADGREVLGPVEHGPAFEATAW